MPKMYILLNHETGEFFIEYSPTKIMQEVEDTVAGGTDLENLSLYFGERKQIIERKIESSIYTIGHKTN